MVAFRDHWADAEDFTSALLAPGGLDLTFDPIVLGLTSGDDETEPNWWYDYWGEGLGPYDPAINNLTGWAKIVLTEPIELEWDPTGSSGSDIVINAFRRTGALWPLPHDETNPEWEDIGGWGRWDKPALFDDFYRPSFTFSAGTYYLCIGASDGTVSGDWTMHMEARPWGAYPQQTNRVAFVDDFDRTIVSPGGWGPDWTSGGSSVHDGAGYIEAIGGEGFWFYSPDIKRGPIGVVGKRIRFRAKTTHLCTVGQSPTNLQLYLRRNHAYTESSYRLDINIGGYTPFDDYLVLFSVINGSGHGVGQWGGVGSTNWKWIAAEISGISPTRIRAKFWNDGDTEPGWQINDTFAEPELQFWGTEQAFELEVRGWSHILIDNVEVTWFGAEESAPADPVSDTFTRTVEAGSSWGTGLLGAWAGSGTAYSVDGTQAHVLLDTTTSFDQTVALTPEFMARDVWEAAVRFKWPTHQVDDAERLKVYLHSDGSAGEYGSSYGVMVSVDRILNQIDLEWWAGDSAGNGLILDQQVTPGSWATIKLRLTLGTGEVRAKYWDDLRVEPMWMVNLVAPASYESGGVQGITGGPDVSLSLYGTSNELVRTGDPEWLFDIVTLENPRAPVSLVAPTDSLWQAPDIIPLTRTGVELALLSDVDLYDWDPNDPALGLLTEIRKLCANGTFQSNLDGWSSGGWTGYTNAAAITRVEHSTGEWCLEAALTGLADQDFKYTLPSELALSSQRSVYHSYVLSFRARVTAGSTNIQYGFGQRVSYVAGGSTTYDYGYAPDGTYYFRPKSGSKVITSEWTTFQLPPTSAFDAYPSYPYADCIWIASYGAATATIQIDDVSLHIVSGPINTYRTAWLSANPVVAQHLIVDTAGSSYDTVLALFQWDGVTAPSPVLAFGDWKYGDLRYSRIAYPLVGGTKYLIGVSQIRDEWASTSLDMHVSRTPMNFGSAKMLRLGVGGAQFATRRPFDVGGIGTSTSVRPFDLTSANLNKVSLRPFDVVGTVRLTSERPFDLGTSGLLTTSSRPFDVIDASDGQPIDPIIIVPPNPDPVNAVQQILITNHTGTFTITFMGQTTTSLAWNAAPATVQSALLDLAALAPGDVVVTAINGGYQLAFAGAYAGIAVAPVVVTLSGGVTVTTQPGIHHTYYLTIRNDASQLMASRSVTVTADAEVEFYVDVLGVSENVVDIVVGASAIQAFYVISDRDVTMTENDDGSPDLTVVLGAGVPYWWYGGFGNNPFTVDLASLKFVNAGASPAHVRAAFLVSA